MTPLTLKQQELLDYLRACESCPSYEEMKQALGLRSKSGVHRMIDALAERGFVRRLKNRARAIELIEDPQLPDKLADITDLALAREARRRGLALCHIYKAEGRREFMELRA